MFNDATVPSQRHSKMFQLTRFGKPSGIFLLSVSMLAGLALAPPAAWGQATTFTWPIRSITVEPANPPPGSNATLVLNTHTLCYLVDPSSTFSVMQTPSQIVVELNFLFMGVACFPTSPSSFTRIPFVPVAAGEFDVIVNGSVRANSRPGEIGAWNAPPTRVQLGTVAVPVPAMDGLGLGALLLLVALGGVWTLRPDGAH